MKEKPQVNGNGAQVEGAKGRGSGVGKDVKERGWGHVKGRGLRECEELKGKGVSDGEERYIVEGNENRGKKGR